MKRSNLKSCFATAATLAMSMVAYAQYDNEPIYDLTAWQNEMVLKLFSTAWEEGRTYPTTEELNSIGMNYIDLESARSHTRYRNIAKDNSRDLISNINHDRLLWYNLPAGNGMNLGGYPSDEFDQDVFSFWNYINLLGPYNSRTLRTPGCWVDAAHKHGTQIYSGIEFFEPWDCDGYSSFQALIVEKNDDKSYKYSHPFVNAAAYFGYDGYNYCDATSTYQTSEWRQFNTEIMKYAREQGLDNFSIGLYPEYSVSLTPNNANYMYGTSDGQIFNCIINTNGGKMAWERVSSSIEAAMGSVGNINGVYLGCVPYLTDYWVEMNTEATKPMNIALFGDIYQSRFFRFRVGDDPISLQENYQKLLEKAFSGANRNPLLRPAINNDWGELNVTDVSLADTQFKNAPGFCSMFPERTAINFALPFETHFSLGNGESYFYKGKVTNGSWYNMSQQDIVPTYRWLVTKKGDMTAYSNDIDVCFTHEDAYMAGSSLKLTGTTTEGVDVILYRTDLQVNNGNVKVTLAVKGTNGATNLSAILKKKGSSEWIEVPFGTLAGNTWEKKTLNVAGLTQGDVIENIGLRVSSANKGYEVYVGKLRISDDRNVVHAGIREGSLIAEVCQEYSTRLSLRLGWQPDYDSFDTSINDFGMVFNDEINVDHFEIFYKEGEEGTIREVGRTAQWATFIGNLPCAQNTNAYIGVRSVSVDLKHNSPIEWVRIPHSEGELPALIEEDPYGISCQTSTGNGTDESCHTHIWVEKVITEGATQNLNYVATSNPCVMEDNQYYFAKDHKLVLTQGQKVKLLYKGNDSGTDESLKYDFVNAYIDYDGNHSFLDADETLGKFGNTKQINDSIVNPGMTIQFTVPADAHIGQSRLRIVGSDAWTPHPGATGGTVKGYSIDFPVEIQGTNPDRQPIRSYKDRRDKGEPKQPEYVDGNIYGTGIESIDTDTDHATVTVVNGVAYFNNTEKAWFYDATGRFVKYVDGTGSVNVSDLNGVYVVKLLNNHVIRSTKVVVK